MSFKTDREFLRNVSVGAVGTRKVAEVLRAGGFQIIELERYSQSNKIWATKIKRLRVPDLLCLKSGIRIESRAKGTLKIIMSHSLANPDRAWDKGLRDSDLVAFIHCRLVDDLWFPAERVNLFRVADMRATFGATVSSRMKAASEGSEIHVTWPACVPKRSGTAEEIAESRIIAKLDSGRRQSYALRVRGRPVRLHAHVAVAERFDSEQQIIASVLPRLVEPRLARCVQYDFVDDLDSSERETVYAAVKALGFLPEFRDRSVPALARVMRSAADPLLQLEAAAALARLDVDEGWSGIEAVASTASDLPVRMESVLILSEFIDNERAARILHDVATVSSHPSELRAAAAWGLSSAQFDVREGPLLGLMRDDDENTAVHAIVAASRLITDDSIGDVLARLGDDDRASAGLVKAILSSPCDPVGPAIVALQSATGSRRQWLLYLLACLGRERCQQCVEREAAELLSTLEFFWRFQNENWTNRLDVADQVDFLRAQMIR